MAYAHKTPATGPDKLDTLAKYGKGNLTTVYGLGCNVSTAKTRERRGKTKFIDIKLALALGDIAKEEKDLAFLKQCKNTYFCLSEVTYKNGRIYGNLCRNRFCTTCNSIRKATLIHQYYPILKNWPDPQFLTLTTKSVKAHELEDLIIKQRKIFGRIIDKYKKRHRKGTGPKIVCLRAHESNFNPQQEWYNPHFHIITPDKETAAILKNEWLKAWGNVQTKPWSQKIVPVRDMEKHLIETIKYGTKVFTDPEAKKGMKGKNYKLYARAYYTIVKAFEGKHLLAKYGFDIPERIDAGKTENNFANTSTLHYLPKFNDWVNLETGSMLTRFNPDIELKKLVAEVDKELM